MRAVSVPCRTRYVSPGGIGPAIVGSRSWCVLSATRGGCSVDEVPRVDVLVPSVGQAFGVAALVLAAFGFPQRAPSAARWTGGREQNGRAFRGLGWLVAVVADGGEHCPALVAAADDVSGPGSLSLPAPSAGGSACGSRHQHAACNT
jgi:hypothetical protein